MIRPATQYSHSNVNTEKMKESQQQPLKTLGMTSAISTAGKRRVSHSYSDFSIRYIF